MIEAGSIFAIARVIDALLSPIMGYVTDNFGDTWLGRKFGRRRFFLLLSSPLMFLYALLWMTDMGYWYYLGTYLSIELLSAMVLVPWETLAAEMTNRYEERSRLSGVRMICSQLGGFLAVSVPGVIMQFTGKDNPFTYFPAYFALRYLLPGTPPGKPKMCSKSPILKWITSAAAGYSIT